MAALPRVLFSGFGPFREHARNASWDVAQAAQAAFGDGAEARLVEVTFAAAARVGGRPLATDLVVALGIAPYADVRVECVAWNRTSGESDVAGVAPTGLDARGPEVRESAVGRSAFADALRDACPLPVRRSEDAGAYVCNALLYHLLGTTEAGGPPAVFVHVPQVDAAQAVDIGVAVAAAARAWIVRGAPGVAS